MSFEVRNTKSNNLIPVVNDVLLHSAYNPEREAELFAAGQDDILKKNNRILVLGLGFGYHINSLERGLRTLYNNDYHVVVIVPNEQTYRYWSQNFPDQLSSNVEVFNFKEIEQFFSTRNLIDFLSLKPSIVTHFASFNLYENFFKSFLSFKYSSKLADNLKFISNDEFRSYLTSAQDQESGPFLESLSRNNHCGEWDFLCMSLAEIVNYKNPEVSNSND